MSVKAYKEKVSKKVALEALHRVLLDNDSVSGSFQNKIKNFDPNNAKIIWLPSVTSTCIITEIRWDSNDSYSYQKGYSGKIEGDSITITPDYESGTALTSHSSNDYLYKYLVPYSCDPKNYTDERVKAYGKGVPTELVDMSIDVDSRLTQLAISKSHICNPKSVASSYLASKNIPVHEVFGVDCHYKDKVVYYPVYEFNIDGYCSYVDAITGEYSVINFAKSEKYYDFLSNVKKSDAIVFSINFIFAFLMLIVGVYLFVSTYWILLESERNPSFIFNIIFLIVLIVAGFAMLAFVGGGAIESFKAKEKEFDKKIHEGRTINQVAYLEKITTFDFLPLLLSFLGGVVIPLVYTLLIAITTLGGSFTSVFQRVFTFDNPLIDAIFG